MSAPVTPVLRPSAEPSVHDFLRARNARLTTLDADAKARCAFARTTDARTVPAWITTFDLVLCTSVLEHVTDVHRGRDVAPVDGRRRILADHGAAQLPPHRSPIDTGYRPTNRDIESLFSI